MKGIRLRRVLLSVVVGAMMCLALAIAKQQAPHPGSRTSATAQVETQEYVQMLQAARFLGSAEAGER